MSEKIHILFDGPPSHVSGRFVEVENDAGASISVGEWKERPDGLWELVIDTACEERDRYKADDAGKRIRVFQEEGMSRPPSGTMVYWRFKRNVPGPWLFGYVTYEKGYELLRMGRYNGDSYGGEIVSASEVEWKPYSN